MESRMGEGRPIGLDPLIVEMPRRNGTGNLGDEQVAMPVEEVMSVEEVFRFMEPDSVASNWMLFEMERKSVPRPWVAGTLMLVDFRLLVDEKLLVMLSQAPKNPFMDIMGMFASPCLLVSELMTSEYTLGSGWILQGTSVNGQNGEAMLNSHTVFERVRFMEYHENGGANLLVVVKMAHDSLIYVHIREVDGRVNTTQYGRICPSTRQCFIGRRSYEIRNCTSCVKRKQVCPCNNAMIRSHFQSQYEQRSVWLGKMSGKSSLGNYYHKTWLAGNYSLVLVDAPPMPLQIATQVLTEGTSFEHSVNFVVQSEIFSLHPPRASRRFMAMLQDINEDELREWSQVSKDAPSSADELHAKRRSSKSNELDIESVSSDSTSARHAPTQTGGFDVDKPAQDECGNVCEECHMSFRRRYDLLRHVRTVHEKRRDFLCETCGKTFSHRGHLNVHVKIVHQDNREFSCSDCDKVFGVRSKLERHIRNVHKNMRKHVCMDCGKAFAEPFHLRRHASSCHGSK